MDPFSITSSAIGVATFTQQLVQSVIMLKQFCNDVRNAPEELKETLDEIEHITQIMQEVGRDEMQSLGGQGETLTRSVHLCKKAAGRIFALTTELQSNVKRNKFGAVRAVMKQQDLRSMHEKLDRSKADLYFAYSMYLDAKRQEDTKQMMDVLE